MPLFLIPSGCGIHSFSWPYGVLLFLFFFPAPIWPESGLPIQNYTEHTNGSTSCSRYWAKRNNHLGGSDMLENMVMEYIRDLIFGWFKLQHVEKHWVKLYLLIRRYWWSTLVFLQRRWQPAVCLTCSSFTWLNWWLSGDLGLLWKAGEIVVLCDRPDVLQHGHLGSTPALARILKEVGRRGTEAFHIDESSALAQLGWSASSNLSQNYSNLY